MQADACGIDSTFTFEGNTFQVSGECRGDFKICFQREHSEYKKPFFRDIYYNK